MTSLIERIEERLKDLDMSERRAQSLAGLANGWINDIRSGKKRNPSYEGLRALAAVLECDLVWLAEGIGDKKAGPLSDDTTRAIMHRLQQYDPETRKAMLRLLNGGSLSDTG